MTLDTTNADTATPGLHAAVSVMPPPTGLSDTEAASRHARGEGNDVSLATSRSYWQILHANLFTVMNGILVTLGITLVSFHRVSDAVLTAGIVIINAIVNVVQEVRAKHLLDHIALRIQPRATAVRMGQERDIDPQAIVRGDLLVVHAGDVIAVDGHMVSGGQIEVDESLLTGEADPVLKHVSDMLYSGSFCVSGSARYIAERVGMASTATTLAQHARTFRQTRTPLQREIDLLMRALVVVVAFLGLLFALVATFTALPTVQSVQRASVIVGLVPNGLVFIVTIAYTIGALRLAGKGVLIQQTNAVESLANVDVLCLDKTGTLTANRLAVHAVEAIGLAEAEFTAALGNYVASATGRNATSDAIAHAYGGQKRPVDAEVPFSSARKWGAVTFTDGTFLLGAPELLPHAALPGDTVQQWTAAGLRVLLFARAPTGFSFAGAAAPLHLPAQVLPLGLIALRDELRPETQATLRGFVDAGVRVKVISGDHPDTVTALARQAGLGGDLHAVSGGELAAMTATAFAQAAEEGTIFARITPPQKAQLIDALRANGHYVAMIGDGVNDVLSLKRAHLGIAMQSGSAATRAVADMVLLEDSFAALPHAVQEGQRILNGMRDCLALYLTRLAYTILVILSVGMVTAVFPFTPTNNALAALFTLGIPTYVLVAWARPGAQSHRGLMRGLIGFIVPGACMMTLLALGIFLVFFARALGGAGRTMVTVGALRAATVTGRSAMTTGIVLGGLVLIAFLPMASRGWTATGTPRDRWRPVGLAFALLALYGGLLLIPRARRFLDLASVRPGEYFAIGAVVIAWAVLLGLVWRFRLFARLVQVE